MNAMKEIRIEKITFNVGTGEAGSKLDRATKLLQSLTNQKPVSTISKKRIPTWGIRPGMTIGTKVTVRKDLDKVAERMLKAVGNKLSSEKVGEGIFSFGIPEHIQIPGTKYDMEIGIMGLGVMVTLERRGFRIKRRTVKKMKIPKKHQITKEETINFLKTKFNTTITD